MKRLNDYIHLRCDERLMMQLNLVAEQKNISRSEAVRGILKWYVQQLRKASIDAGDYADYPPEVFAP